jgi:hypothetical protein
VSSSEVLNKTNSPLPLWDDCRMQEVDKAGVIVERGRGEGGKSKNYFLIIGKKLNVRSKQIDY